MMLMDGAHAVKWGMLEAAGGKLTEDKGTPKQPGVDEIRIPSENACRERVRRRKEGILFDKKVVGSLKIIAAGRIIEYQ